MAAKLREHYLGFVCKFNAMACDCEIIIESQDIIIANQIGKIAYDEVKRIERKYSRYNKEGVVYEINQGKKVKLDEESFKMFLFANQVYELSDGLFDITSGITRKIWKFDGSDKIPTRKKAKDFLKYIGWKKVEFNQEAREIKLKEGMEIDLGGIGKEYACDKAIELINQKFKDVAVIVNLGGDLRVTQNLKNNQEGKESWQVEIKKSSKDSKTKMVNIKQGAVVTSGDEYRFLEKNGVRYSHIINPRTAWSVNNAPSSVTVCGATCLESGFLSTLAMFHGKNAESFLQEQGVDFYVQ